MENSKKAQIHKQEETALNHALMWFGAAVVLEFLLLLTNKYYVNFNVSASAVAVAQVLSVVLKIVAVGGLAAGVFLGIWGWKRFRAKGALCFAALLGCVSALALGVSAALVVLFRNAAVQLLYVLVPSGAVLALVFYLYQKEFFLSVCSVGMGLLGLWLVRRNGGGHDVLVYCYMVLAALALLGMMVLAIKLQKGNGVLNIGGRPVRVLPKRSNFLQVLLSCQVSLLVMLAGLILGSTAAFYLLFVLLAWLFILLVYYTVKLM